MGLEIIEKLKKEKNLTSKELSELSSVPKGTLDKILNGTTKDPKLETLKSLARVLGCKLDDFDDKEVTNQENNLISLHEKKLLTDFNKLNDLGKEKVLEDINDLTHLGKYTEQDYLMPIAAHNDNNDPEQQRLMQEDLDEL